MTTASINRDGHIRDALVALRGSELSEIERWRTALVLALYAGELEHAHRIVADASEYAPAVTVLDDVLAPAMHDIGALWANHEISIADEHLATALAHRLLAVTAESLLTAPPRSRERVLLASAAADRHFLGLSMASDVLYGAGFDTVMLGDGLPDVELIAALRRHRPAVVALSVTAPGDDAVNTARAVCETLPEVPLIVGGAGGRPVAAAVGAEYVGRLEGLVSTVERLLG